ncbi:P-loop containing nucleoside triphosphate hydrolase protein [Setomelanomma holmii]|uniref:P-loop containing nucleoside triphosphate hydrolase protein n=1 Tax=Setomelanomma holmii TaxID=210430 RepID=A0A9P4LUL3_9PLEO|nr:P-loop containing nucleoside triphosphate hydrolase protein [Setomelanomma holmii]
MVNSTEDRKSRDTLAEAWDAMGRPAYDSGRGEISNEAKGAADGPHLRSNSTCTPSPRKTQKTISEIKNLYASLKSACECCTSWEDEKPFKEDQKTDDKTKNANEDYAIVLRQRAHGGHHTWKVDSLDIHSPLIRDVLASAFADYAGLDLQAPTISFSKPFIPLVHRWEQCVDKQEDDETNQHIGLLKEALEDEVADSIKARDYLETTGNITFSHLPLAFVPGETVIQSKNGTLSAGTLTECSIIKQEGKDYALFSVEVVDWNGRMCGIDEIQWWVRAYNGHKSVIKLDVFPLRLHPERRTLESKLVDRGRVFERYCGQEFCHFRGAAYWKHTEIPSWLSEYYSATQKTDLWKLISTRQVEGRVIIDAWAYHKFQDQTAPRLRPFDEEKIPKSTHQAFSSFSPFASNTLVPDEVYDTDDNPEPISLTDQQCMLAVPKVKGFFLDRRIWGKGIIMLLCGPPGVGKTLTAESIAEQVRRPLYRTGAGDLGSSPEHVERNLTAALERCAHWNAVLLIDEADVFLEARSRESLERNKLVSIFLRLLEYYRGIMILTTNRSSGIDPAFESRVDVTIPYPELSKKAQARVWHNFFQRMPAGEADIDEVAVQKLVSTSLNGRQVKSAIKMATVLSRRERVPLRIEHLQICLNIRSQARKVLAESGTGDRSGFAVSTLSWSVSGLIMITIATSLLWLCGRKLSWRGEAQ